MKWFVRFVFVVLFLFLVTPRVIPASAQSPSAFASDMLFTGRVTAADTGAPLANVQAVLVNATFNIEPVGYAVTDASGYYTVTQVIGSSWWVAFAPGNEANYFAEYYNDLPLPATEDDYWGYTPPGVPIFYYEPGMVRSGIDAALRVKGQSQIRGRVTAAPDETPLAEVRVSVYDAGGNHLVWYTGYTDSSGIYTVTHLVEGTYKLRYNYEKYAAEEHYVVEYYGGVTSIAEAEEIEVGNNEIVDNIDITLPVGGAIKGIVNSSFSAGGINPRISVYDQSDQLVTIVYEAFPSYEKNYVVRNLAAGQYRLFIEDSNNSHRPEYYQDQVTLDQAQPITVEAGVVTTNINATLTYTPSIVSIATSKALPNSIVVATNDNPAPRFTTDGGQNWQRVATTPWKPAAMEEPYFYDSSLGLAPREELSGRRILYNDYDKIYRSGDLGETWSVETADNPCVSYNPTNFERIVTSPIDPLRFYAKETCRIPGDWAGGWTYNWLSVSTDGGVSWRLKSTEELQEVAWIVPSPVVAGRLYVSQESLPWSQSDDNGENWQTRNFPVSTLVPDGQNADYLYCWSVRDGPPSYFVGMRSDDGGENWVDWAQPPCLNSYGLTTLLALPTESKLLFALCSEGLFRSDNGGDSWTRVSDDNKGLLVLDLGVPGRLLLGKEGELWASTDRGESWQRLMDINGQSLIQQHFPLYLPSISTEAP